MAKKENLAQENIKENETSKIENVDEDYENFLNVDSDSPRKALIGVGRQNFTKINMNSHMGLRSLLTVWIVIFHSFHYSELNLDLQGSSLMTPFCLLSGFTLSTIYDPREKTIRWGKFFQKRFARIFPIFWLCNFIASFTIITGWSECGFCRSIDDCYEYRYYSQCVW